MMMMMMMTSASYGGHSAQVKMRLLANGSSMVIAQMGPDYLFVDAPIDHPPGDASVLMQVDECERRWTVYLPDGISASSRRVVIAVKE